jgi:hypothetical protein
MLSTVGHTGLFRRVLLSQCFRAQNAFTIAPLYQPVLSRAA